MYKVNCDYWFQHGRQWTNSSITTSALIQKSNHEKSKGSKNGIPPMTRHEIAHYAEQPRADRSNTAAATKQQRLGWLHHQPNHGLHDQLLLTKQPAQPSPWMLLPATLCDNQQFQCHHHLTDLTGTRFRSAVAENFLHVQTKLWYQVCLTLIYWMDTTKHKIN